MDKHIRLESCSVISTHLKRPTLKNIENSIRHIITSEINFLSPSDRLLSFCVEGAVTKNNVCDLRIEIRPHFVDFENPNKHQALRKSIIFQTLIPLDTLTQELPKEIDWVLLYFGFNIMYITKKFKHIEIAKCGKGYTLEYTS